MYEVLTAGNWERFPFAFLSLKNLSVLVSAVKPAKNRNYMKRKIGLKWNISEDFSEKTRQIMCNLSRNKPLNA